MEENKTIKSEVKYDPYTDKFVDVNNIRYNITSNKTLTQEELDEIFMENYYR